MPQICCTTVILFKHLLPNGFLPRIRMVRDAHFPPPLALGYELPQAVANAKDYVTMAITHALEIGKGHGPTHHLYDIYQNGLTVKENEHEL